MRPAHTLDRRVLALAGAARKRTDAIRRSLVGEGDQPPFTEAMTEREALGWWRSHWQDDYGRRAKEALLARPDGLMQITQLEMQIARLIEAERMGVGYGDAGYGARPTL